MKFRHLVPMAGMQQCMLRATHTRKVFILRVAGRGRTRTNGWYPYLAVFARVQFRE
jgi:hypothetical protein